MIAPPAGVSPSDLFLRLIEWRPREPLTFRLQAAPEIQLWAQAVTSAVVKRARSESDGGSLALVSEALVDAMGERVLDQATLGRMVASELSELQSEVGQALVRICPISGTIDTHAWISLLKAGAQQNPMQRSQIALCFDVLQGSKRTVLRQRPDRYFQKPISELLDGHLMVFRAVHDLIDP